MSARMTPLEHYDAAVDALEKAQASSSAGGTAAAAAVAQAHLHAAELLLRIDQGQRPRDPQVVLR